MSSCCAPSACHARETRFWTPCNWKNIGVGVHFRGLHLHPYYRDRFGFKPGQFPAAEYASDRVLSLPLYPGMDDKAVDDTIAAVRKVVHRSRSVR